MLIGFFGLGVPELVILGLCCGLTVVVPIILIVMFFGRGTSTKEIDVMGKGAGYDDDSKGSGKKDASRFDDDSKGSGKKDAGRFDDDSEGSGKKDAGRYEDDSKGAGKYGKGDQEEAAEDNEPAAGGGGEFTDDEK